LGEEGFTLVEVMIVCLIISIIVAIAIPNFIRLQDRAREANVKSNMHTIQLALEDFAVQTLGIYPQNAADATPSGQTVEDLCPGGAYPLNPFTDAATVILWGVDPAVAGVIGINPANSTDYVVKGHGRDVPLLLELSSGM
jgi:prepilin-type N-terminal cleavage/methylation domain-containing protein